MDFIENMNPTSKKSIMFTHLRNLYFARQCTLGYSMLKSTGIFFTFSGTPIDYSIFCLWLSFRVGVMGFTFFLGFSCPNLLLVFLNLLFLGTC